MAECSLSLAIVQILLVSLYKSGYHNTHSAKLLSSSASAASMHMEVHVFSGDAALGTEVSLLVQSRAYIQAAKTRAAPPLPVVLLLLLLLQVLKLQCLLLLQGLLPIQTLLCQAL